jgi:transposase
MRVDVLGAVERRRRWTDAEKLAEVCEAGLQGASVTQVAQRHDLRRQQIWAWRHDLHKNGVFEPKRAALFLPVKIPPPAVPEAKVAAEIAAPKMEIALRNGHQFWCLGRIGDDDLARRIRLIEAA